VEFNYGRPLGTLYLPIPRYAIAHVKVLNDVLQLDCVTTKTCPTIFCII